ncbi:MAG: hypothetical protein JO323_03070 [Acidobacteriia bacterium]|nr:hypothetical protein [Terriglobia bacterium]
MDRLATMTNRRTLFGDAMNIPANESNVVHMPAELLAEARKAADEEHRPADELVSEAVRRYLEARKPSANAARRKSLAQFLMDSPLAGANLDLERRKEYPRRVEL